MALYAQHLDCIGHIRSTLHLRTDFWHASGFFLFGMWYAKDSSGKLRALIRSPAMLAFAILYLVFSLTVALSWQVEAFEAFLPQMLSKVIYAIDKSNLDPLRLLHFFALALVVARLMPQNWRGPSSLWATAAIRCGENSLAIFCLSVLLSFIGHVVLVNTSGAFQYAALDYRPLLADL